jgi:hypothetical protein
MALAEPSGGLMAVERIFEIRVPPMVTEIFEVATSSVLGDRASTFF